ncbi:MAG: isochorismatase family protein, partial [Phenylobacterium sp.]
MVTGVATSAGVESTARFAHELGFNVTLATDAMTDISAEAHENSVTRIFPRMAETGTSAAILALLGKADARGLVGSVSKVTPPSLLLTDQCLDGSLRGSIRQTGRVDARAHIPSIVRNLPMAADGNITKDLIYDAVAPDDFESMLELDRYNARSTAFDKIISATHDHFWDPLDKKYIDFDEPFDMENTMILPEKMIGALQLDYVNEILGSEKERIRFANAQT